VSLFRKEKSNHLPWNPDFRDTEALPDLNSVRFGFLLNISCIALFLGAFLFHYTYSLELDEIKMQMNALTEHLGQKGEQYRLLIKKDMQFERDSKILQRFRDFTKGLLNPVDFLVEVSGMRMDGMVLDGCVYERVIREQDKEKIITYKVNIKGSIQGNYQEELSRMDKYTDELEAGQIYRRYGDTIQTASLKRDPQLDIFTFEVLIVLNPFKK